MFQNHRLKYSNITFWTILALQNPISKDLQCFGSKTTKTSLKNVKKSSNVVLSSHCKHNKNHLIQTICTKYFRIPCNKSILKNNQKTKFDFLKNFLASTLIFHQPSPFCLFKPSQVQSSHAFQPVCQISIAAINSF